MDGKAHKSDHTVFKLHDLFRVVGDQLTSRDVRVLKLMYNGIFTPEFMNQINDGFSFLQALEKIDRIDESNFKNLETYLRMINRYDLFQFLNMRTRKTVMADPVTKYLEDCANGNTITPSSSAKLGDKKEKKDDSSKSATDSGKSSSGSSKGSPGSIKSSPGSIKNSPRYSKSASETISESSNNDIASSNNPSASSNSPSGSSNTHSGSSNTTSESPSSSDQCASKFSPGKRTKHVTPKNCKRGQKSESIGSGTNNCIGESESSEHSGSRFACSNSRRSSERRSTSKRKPSPAQSPRRSARLKRRMDTAPGHQDNDTSSSHGNNMANRTQRSILTPAPEQQRKKITCDIRLRVRAEYVDHATALQGHVHSNKPDRIERQFERFMQANTILKSRDLGSIICDIKFSELTYLDAFWRDYINGSLLEALKGVFITESLKQAVGHEAIKLLVNVDEDDYEAGRLVLLNSLKEAA